MYCKAKKIELRVRCSKSYIIPYTFHVQVPGQIDRYIIDKQESVEMKNQEKIKN
jgi:hypothetical protein